MRQIRLNQTLVTMLSAGLLIAASGPPAAGQRGRPQKEILRLAFRPAAVAAGNGETVPIETGACQAKLGGSEARILGVRPPGTALMILVVTDLTGNLGIVQPAKEALAEEITKTGDKTWVGLLRCGDGLQVLLDPTNESEPLRDALTKLSVSVNPGLLDSLEPALRLGHSILDRSAVRLAVVYVTDSNIYDYRADYVNPSINPSDYRDMSRRFPEALVKEKISQLNAKLRAFHPPLFIVHLDYRNDPLNQAYQTGLLQLATESGGAAQFCRSRAEIPEAMRSVFAQIAALYGIDLAPPAGALARSTPLTISCGERELRYRSVLSHDGR